MSNVRVKVAQSGGEILVAVGGDEPTRFNVTDGHVSVPQDQVAAFLARVDGSSVAGSPSTKKES